MQNVYAVIKYDIADKGLYTLLGIFSTPKLAVDYIDSRRSLDQGYYIVVKEIDIDKGIDSIFDCWTIISQWVREDTKNDI